ncbi:MAG: hypothetical protein QNK37_05075 [Acidobacteriota bacterium]|nr:hypothetical protein [Acidobacteriota bacterium]
MTNQKDEEEAQTSPHVVSFNPERDTWKKLQERTWQKYAATLLNHHDGNVKAAGKVAGLSKSQFYAKLGNKKEGRQ